jgi:glycosyltransferase involved in cell wall biosynthesis
MNNQSTIFIGMPAYNEERYIKSAIVALQKQTYKNWILFISDNQSSDNTSKICKYFSNIDERVVYYQQDENIGLMSNFEYVANIYINKYKNKYFMWAQSDDLWGEDFLKDCVFLLESNTVNGVAFSAMDNIDTYSRVVRQYESFNRFSSLKTWKNRLKYLLEPEILGKSNIFLGLYRYSVISDIMSRVGFSEMYSDYVIAYRIVSSSHLSVTNKVLFHKRSDSGNDKKKYITPIIHKSIRDSVFSVRTHFKLHCKYFMASQDFQGKISVVLVMIYRFPKSIKVSLVRLATLNYKLLKHTYDLFFNFYAGRLLGFLDYTKFLPEIKIDVGYGHAFSSSCISPSLKDLRVNICTDDGVESMAIYNTPHYKFINEYIKKGIECGAGCDGYTEYKKKFFKDLDIDNQVKTFKNIANDISNDFKDGSLNIVILIKKEVNRHNYKFSVIDGSHRLAILASLGINNTNCYFVDRIEGYENH